MMPTYKMAAVLVALALAGCEVRNAPDNSIAEAGVPAEGNGAADAVAADHAASGPATAADSDKPLAVAAASSDLKWGPCPDGMPDGCQIAVLHGDPAKPNADVFLKVPGGSAIAAHWHSSAERMMLAGGRLTVKYLGAAETTLEPGSYAYGPARLPHRANCASAEPCTLFIAFEGPVDRHSFEGKI